MRDDPVLDELLKANYAKMKLKDRVAKLEAALSEIANADNWHNESVTQPQPEWVGESHPWMIAKRALQDGQE